MDNAFTTQFGSHLQGVYSCFDRVIVRGYIHPLFCEGGMIRFLRSAGFRTFTNGVMRIFTDQLNAHVEKIAKREGIDILWWPSVDGGKNGAKQEYVEKHFVRKHDRRKGNFMYRIIADMERTQSFATRTLQKKNGEPFDKRYSLVGISPYKIGAKTKDGIFQTVSAKSLKSYAQRRGRVFRRPGLQARRGRLEVIPAWAGGFQKNPNKRSHKSVDGRLMRTPQS